MSKKKKKPIAIALTIIIAISVGAGWYFLVYRPANTLPPLGNTSSPDQGTCIVHEVHPTGNASSEFIELFIPGPVPATRGWSVTTYDGDRVVFPNFTGTGSNVYVLVHSTTGTDDVNCSDNQVILHAGHDAAVLAPAGDEVGVHDATGKVLDFFRYGGGNGNPVLGGWPASDAGPTRPTASDRGLSLIGETTRNSTHWETSPLTPGEPNVATFQTSPTVTATGTYGGEELWITNGLRAPISGQGLDEEKEEVNPDLPGASASRVGIDNITVRNGSGVCGRAVDLVREHLNFSLDFYRRHGFTGGPQTAADGKIHVVLINSTDDESAGEAWTNGTIIINIGRKWTKEELKVVGEHELMHLFQFKTHSDGAGGTYRHCWWADKWWIEGQAEFWGLWSMFRNYPHMTYASWMAMARTIGSLNWHDHYRDLNGTWAFKNWVGSWSTYMASFLFMKFINETREFGVFNDVFNRTRYYGPGDARNVDPKKAFEAALGKSWAEIYREFLEWLLMEAPQANGLPAHSTPHHTMGYDGTTTVGDNANVMGWGGAVIEEINVSANTNNPLNIALNRTPGAVNKLLAFAIVFYADGTKGKVPIAIDPATGQGGITIDPNDPKRVVRVWVVKSAYGDYSVRVTMRVTPVYSQMINLTYTNTTTSDTATVGPSQVVHEMVNVANPHGFRVNFNTQPANANFTIVVTKYYSDGSVEEDLVEIVNGQWPDDYYINGDESTSDTTRTLLRVAFIKYNFMTIPGNITMELTPDEYYRRIPITYGGGPVGDSAGNVPQGASVLEDINVTSPIPFKLNFTFVPPTANLSITVTQYWSDGSSTSDTVNVVNGQWPEYFVSAYKNLDSADPHLVRCTVIKNNTGTVPVSLDMNLTPDEYDHRVSLTYNNDTVEDTVLVPGNGLVLENITISKAHPFRLNLTVVPPNANFTIIIVKHWSNGEATGESVDIVNGQWPDGYDVNVRDPTTTPAPTLARVEITKLNLDSTPATLTTRLTPLDHAWVNTTDLTGEPFQDTAVVPATGVALYNFTILTETAFTLFLESGPTTDWTVWVTRYWDDATADTTTVNIVDGYWPGFLAIPHPGPKNLVKLGVQVASSNAGTENIIVKVTPAGFQFPEDPHDRKPDHSYDCEARDEPDPSLNGLLQGYALWEGPGVNYELTFTELGPTDEFRLEFYDGSLTKIDECVIRQDQPSYMLSVGGSGPVFFRMYALSGSTVTASMSYTTI